LIVFSVSLPSKSVIFTSIFSEFTEEIDVALLHGKRGYKKSLVNSSACVNLELEWIPILKN